MAQFVGLAVQSALDQTCGNFEIVICDNASTDNTSEVLAQFQDPRIKIIRNPENVGAIRNFNLAIERASGEWIKFLEADDLLSPTCLEKCVQMIERDLEVDVVSVGRTRIYEDGTPFLREVHWETEIASGTTVRRRVHIRHNEFGTPTDVMARKELLVSVGGFDTDYGTYLNDWDLWLRCQDQARKVAFVAESLVKVRSHGGQIGATGAKSNTDIDVLYKMLEKRWKEYPVLSELGRQGLYLRLRLGVPYVYRGLRQVMRHKIGGSISQWDTFQRLYRHLGAMNLFVLIVWALIYYPFFPYLNNRITNLQRVSVAGLSQPRSETPTNGGKF
jgi:glycosyltransferase involved in cell wall biosynthesis